MTDGWIETTLGDCLDTVDTRAGLKDPELVLSVTEKRGIVPQTEVFRKRIATKSVAKYKVLEPYDIAYNPYLLWTGAVGQWLGALPGVTSPVYECFRAKPEHEPRFLGLLLESGLLTPYFDSTAIGSIQRRRRTTLPVFRAAKVRMPPLEAQRRIVDLMEHLDAHLANLQADVEACERLEGPLFEALVVASGEEAETVPLGKVGQFIRGRRFTKDEYVASGLGCIHYGQIHTHFRPIARKSLTFLPEESRTRLRLARPGDVVIAATSEDVDGLGKATVWLGDDDVAVHDDCQIFRHSLEPKFASYVFISPWFQQQKRQYAGGSKVTRISGADLAKIEMPIPPIRVQNQIGEALGALSDHVDSLRQELAVAQRLRATILLSLLTRQIEIPESYDTLLDGTEEQREVAS